jgi:tetratricopeptide (TPR) repeat protein
MKNKSDLPFLFLFSFLTIISCKKKFDPDEFKSKRIISADSLIRLAHDKFDSKNFEEAYNLGNAAISYNPGYSRALVVMGNAQIELGNYSKAIELFTFAVNDPGTMQHYEFEKVYQKRAFAKEELKDYRGALVDYNILIDQFDSRYGYYHRGIIKYNFLEDANGACSDWSIAGEKGYSISYDLIDKFCNNY